MSDCDLDCDGDCFDSDYCPDCDCQECNCCCGHCDGCDFSCNYCGGNSNFACCCWVIDDSPRYNHKSELSHCCGGGGAVKPPPHRIVKEEPKPNKISRLKKIFMFWKTCKENAQEQKPAEKQLDEISHEQMSRKMQK